MDRKRQNRLAQTVAEATTCLDDARQLVALGKHRFDDDRLVRRAAKNIVTEFAETTIRLPVQFREDHRDVPWRAIGGMRNRVVHVYENTDPEIIWAVLEDEMPKIRLSLDL